MTQDKIGIIYQIITSVFALIGGVLLIIYRKKFLELQKKYFSKQNDPFNKKILESIEGRSEKNSYILIITIASFFIIVAIVQLVGVLRG